MGKLRIVNKRNSKIQKVAFSAFPIFKYEGNTDTYYITEFPNPVDPAKTLIVCSCKDFQLGRPARGINPYENPCKHIVDYLKSKEKK